MPQPITFNPRMYLPRADGTKEVFCENSNKRIRPCDERVKLAANGELISGVAIVTSENIVPTYFCGWKCVARHSNSWSK